MRNEVPGDPAVEEPMANAAMPWGALIESNAKGEEVPMPSVCVALVRMSPPANVLVAVFCCRILPPVKVRPFDEVKLPARNPPAKVDVPVVLCRSSCPWAITVLVAAPVPVSKKLPATASWDPGLVVPIPTLPCESMMNAVEVADAEEVAMSRSGVADSERPAMARRAFGEEDEMPTLPN